MYGVVFEASVSFFDGVVQVLAEQGNGLVGNIDHHEKILLTVVDVVVLRVHPCHRRVFLVLEGRERASEFRRLMMLRRCQWRKPSKGAVMVRTRLERFLNQQVIVYSTR